MLNSLKHNTDTLSEWHKLFTKKQKTYFSKHSYFHWKNVKSLGIPTSKNKNWKYTSLTKLFTNHFIESINNYISIEKKNSLGLQLNSYTLVFINGNFSHSLSDNNIGNWKIQTKYEKNNQLTKNLISSDIFLHLIESLSKKIIKILLPKGKIEKIPLYILHINQGSKEKNTLTTINCQYHIELETGSEGQIIEHFVSDNCFDTHFNGTKTSIIINNNANLNYIKLGLENYVSYHFGYNEIYINHDSIVNSNIIMLGAKFNRHKTSVKINGKGSYLRINSLLMPKKNTINEIRTYLEHNSSNCKSKQLHKIIVHKHGKGIFNGLIKVNKYAKQTTSSMINNNLLLDKLSKVNSKPQLKIYTDDIKCTHASTTGYLDTEQILYLRSRGISYKNAKKMIILSFFSDFIEKIHNKKLQQVTLTHIYKILKNYK
ncbi:MAG: Fe-S cluster scaffold complex subunit SufD [Candidatus Westeberhardia cardiocondylae]|nr:Fe-S cluster scaffold complex subunit SufD [Candidatus Westeberhardia cardiocondylae]